MRSGAYLLRLWIIIIISFRLIVCAHDILILNWSISKRNHAGRHNTHVHYYVRKPARKRETEWERDFVVTGLHAFISHSPNFSPKFLVKGLRARKKGFTYCVHLKWTDKVKLDFFLQFSLLICLKMQKRNTNWMKYWHVKWTPSNWAKWKQCKFLNSPPNRIRPPRVGCKSNANANSNSNRIVYIFDKKCHQ